MSSVGSSLEISEYMYEHVFLLLYLPLSLREVIEGVGKVILAIIPLVLTDSLQVNK